MSNNFEGDWDSTLLPDRGSCGVKRLEGRLTIKEKSGSNEVSVSHSKHTRHNPHSGVKEKPKKIKITVTRDDGKLQKYDGRLSDDENTISGRYKIIDGCEIEVAGKKNSGDETGTWEAQKPPPPPPDNEEKSGKKSKKR